MGKDSTFDSQLSHYYTLIGGITQSIKLESLEHIRELLVQLNVDICTVEEHYNDTKTLSTSDLHVIPDFAELYNNDNSFVYPEHLSQFQEYCITKLKQFAIELQNTAPENLTQAISTQNNDIANNEIKKNRNSAELHLQVSQRLDMRLTASIINKMELYGIDKATRLPEAEICIRAAMIAEHIEDLKTDDELNNPLINVMRPIKSNKIETLLRYLLVDILQIFDIETVIKASYNLEIKHNICLNIKYIFNGKSLTLQSYRSLDIADKFYLINCNIGGISQFLSFDYVAFKFCLTGLRLINYAASSASSSSIYEEYYCNILHEARSLLSANFSYTQSSNENLSQTLQNLKVIIQMLNDGIFTFDIIQSCDAEILSFLLEQNCFIRELVKEYLLPEEYLLTHSPDFFKKIIDNIESIRYIFQKENINFKDIANLNTTQLILVMNNNVLLSDFCYKSGMHLRELVVKPEIMNLVISDPQNSQKIIEWLNYSLHTKNELFNLSATEIQSIINQEFVAAQNLEPNRLNSMASPDDIFLTCINKLLISVRKLGCEKKLSNLTDMHNECKNMAIELIASGVEFYMARAIYDKLIAINKSFVDIYISMFHYVSTIRSSKNKRKLQSEQLLYVSSSAYSKVIDTALQDYTAKLQLFLSQHTADNNVGLATDFITSLDLTRNNAPYIFHRLEWYCSRGQMYNLTSTHLLIYYCILNHFEIQYSDSTDLKWQHIASKWQNNLGKITPKEFHEFLNDRISSDPYIIIILVNIYEYMSIMHSRINQHLCNPYITILKYEQIEAASNKYKPKLVGV